MLDLFNQVIILPGVEITLNPGIHILVIFDDGDIQEMKNLLSKLGYHLDSCGHDSKIIIDTDVLKFLQMEEIKDKIVIAPHVDQDSGIYQLKKGIYRSRIFQSDKIVALMCNNINQIENIRQLLDQPDYRRTSPIAFINVSDAHKQADIGSKSSYFILPDLNYAEVRSAFSSPEQSIRNTRNPDTDAMIREVISTNKTSVLMELDEMCSYICASLNSGYWNIVIGVDSHHRIKGVDFNSDKIDVEIRKAITFLTSDDLSHSIKHFSEELGNGRFVHVYTLRNKTRSMWYITETGSTYFFRDSGELYSPSAMEVESRLRRVIADEYMSFEENYNKELSIIKTRISLLNSPFRKHLIYSNICKKRAFIKDYVNIRELNPEKQIDLDDYSIGTGNPSGNTVCAASTRPRQPDHYLRFSAIMVDSILTKDVEIHSGESIIITIPGASYYINQESFFIKTDAPLLIITPKDPGISLKPIMAWLKSKIGIWSTLWKSNDPSCYFPILFENAIIPAILFETMNSQELLILFLIANASLSRILAKLSTHLKMNLNRSLLVLMKKLRLNWRKWILCLQIR